jgi:hypothetical protein
LFVFDQARQRTWRSSPLKAAKETGMYAGDGPDPEVMERAMAAAEGGFGTIVGNVIKTAMLPTGDDWIEFLGFIAVMFVRVPKYRDRYKQAANLLGNPNLHAALSRPDGEQALREALAKCGFPSDGFTVAEMKTLLDTEGTEFLSGPSIYLYVMSHNAGQLVPILRQRSWTLWTCDQNAPDLICSDHPVSVSTGSSRSSGEEFGLGSPDTFVSLPLSRRIAIVGTYEQPFPRMTLDRADVAALNSATAMYANQIYSPTPDFVWMMRDWRIGTAAEFLAPAV